MRNSFVVLWLGVASLALTWWSFALSPMRLGVNHEKRSVDEPALVVPVSTAAANLNSSMTLQEFHDLNSRLIEDEPPKKVTCGRKNFLTNCPRLYQLEDVQRSSVGPFSVESQDYMITTQAKRYTESAAECLTPIGVVSSSGGWCLRKAKKHIAPLVVNASLSIAIARGHLHADAGLCRVLNEFIVEHNIQSLSDLGAGVGQYGHCVAASSLSSVQHVYSYDGAGNVELHTGGLVKYADFTLPLYIPRTEWVMSFEVGEHIASSKEGMFIRNLHATNCRGILLSWATMKQVGGTGHVNLHDNEYLIRLFTDLGYVQDFVWERKMRDAATSSSFFQNSLMIFRRITPVC
jgi:hypothetical protein